MYQMSPMNWIMLMMFFISIFLFMNILIYYFINYNMKFNNLKNFKTKNLNWKW